LHAQFYDATHVVDVLNYLALERFLKLGGRRVVHLMAVGEFPKWPEMSQPFYKLESWDKASKVQGAHVPGWWTAYNKVKHSDAGLKAHATMANATAAVAALYLLIERVYGFGILSGGFVTLPHKVDVKHEPGKGRVTTFRSVPQWARLFGKV
jgi:hypothetical protein